VYFFLSFLVTTTIIRNTLHASIEILDLHPEEIMFDACNVLRMMVVVTRKDKKKYTYQLSSNIISSGCKSRISIEACNVLRMMVVVTRKDKKKYTYQLSRDDRYPKLCNTCVVDLFSYL